MLQSLYVSLKVEFQLLENWSDKLNFTFLPLFISFPLLLKMTKFECLLYAKYYTKVSVDYLFTLILTLSINNLQRRFMAVN